jgi:hypothetical protein
MPLRPAQAPPSAPHRKPAPRYVPFFLKFVWATRAIRGAGKISQNFKKYLTI